MTDPVLIAGAGPVGLTLVSEPVRYGVPVRLVDKASARTDKSKALVLWSRTLELLDRGGDGATPFVTAGLHMVAINFVAGDCIGVADVRSLDPFGPGKQAAQQIDGASATPPRQPSLPTPKSSTDQRPDLLYRRRHQAAAP